MVGRCRRSCLHLCDVEERSIFFRVRKRHASGRNMWKWTERVNSITWNFIKFVALTSLPTKVRVFRASR